MLNNKNSLTVANECLRLLLDYETMSDSDFEKYVLAIRNIHKLEFGMNAFYTEYLNKFEGVEAKHRKEVFNKMGEFINWLAKKDGEGVL